MHNKARFTSFIPVVFAISCRSAPPTPGPQASASAVASQAPPALSASGAPRPTGAPLDRLIPPPRPGPRALCPLTIEPGVSLGPVSLGETLADLERAGLKPKRKSDTYATLALSSGTLDLALCQEKIIQIWIDDLRKAPDCVTHAGKPISRATSLNALKGILGGCDHTDRRLGGNHDRCQQGGVYLGTGIGSFLQIRVASRSLPFDNTCAIATDDGSPVELSPEDRVELLKKVLLLPALSPHWHADQPGRDPLLIVKTPLVPAEPLIMFGSPVRWVDEPEAGSAAAFFRLIRLDATRTRATIDFAYPVEGVRGTAVFQGWGGFWFLEKSSVSER